MFLEERARPRTLGPVTPHHLILFRRQNLPPLLVGLDDLELLRRLCHLCRSALTPYFDLNTLPTSRPNSGLSLVPSNPDRDKRASALLAKNRIDALQQGPLDSTAVPTPARSSHPSAGSRRTQAPRCAGRTSRAARTIAPGRPNDSSANHSVPCFRVNWPLKSDTTFSAFSSGSLPARPLAHARQLLLHASIGERRRTDLELAGQAQLLDHVPVAGRKLEISVKANSPDHQRLVTP